METKKRSCNHRWTPMVPARLMPQPQRFGVRRVLAALERRLVAVELARAQKISEPLDVALLGRRVGQAAKAVTSLRTPNFCRPCANFHHCCTDGPSAAWAAPTPSPPCNGGERLRRMAQTSMEPRPLLMEMLMEVQMVKTRTILLIATLEAGCGCLIRSPPVHQIEARPPCLAEVPLPILVVG